MKKLLVVLLFALIAFNAFADEPAFKWSNELGFAPIIIEEQESGKSSQDLVYDSIYDEFKIAGGIGRFYTDDKYKFFRNSYYSETFLGWVCNDLIDLQCFIVAGANYEEDVKWKDTHYESINPSFDFKIGKYNEINVGINFDFYAGDFVRTTFPVYWKIHN